MSDAGATAPGLGRAGLVREGVAQALQVIRGHKMRSLLLILGVAIGVATLLGIVTIVNGLSGKIRDDIVSSSRPYLNVARYTGLGGEDIEEMMRRPQLEPELLPLVAATPGVEINSEAAAFFAGGKARSAATPPAVLRYVRAGLVDLKQSLMAAP